MWGVPHVTGHCNSIHRQFAPEPNYICNIYTTIIDCSWVLTASWGWLSYSNGHITCHVEAEKRGLKLGTILRAKNSQNLHTKLPRPKESWKGGRYNKSLHLPCPVNKVRNDGEQEVSTRWIAPVTLLLYATVRYTQVTLPKEIAETQGLRSRQEGKQGAQQQRWSECARMFLYTIQSISMQR